MPFDAPEMPVNDCARCRYRDDAVGPDYPLCMHPARNTDAHPDGRGIEAVDDVPAPTWCPGMALA